MSHYQPYAPTPSLPPPTTTLNLDTEQKLYTTSSDRDLWASLSELHAILISLETVEKAHVKDTIPAATYTATTTRLLSQYSALLSDPAVAAAFRSIDHFTAEYHIACPAAVRRVRDGLPTAAPVTSSTSAKLAAEATQNFITFMDALRLKFRAKDELHPLLAPVIASVDAVTGGKDGARFAEHRTHIVKWLIRLNSMKAGEEISEQEERECLWDMERAYQAFLEGLA